MAISDKTRKILWVRSGNRCAICRQKLVLDKSEQDKESIVGDECHIISGRANGPRYDSNYDLKLIDLFDNLLILCKTHHKMIDDQTETYTTDVLYLIKKNHEEWVETKLSHEETIKPARIKRIKENIPQKLPRINNGKELMEMAKNVDSFYQDFPSDLSTDEVELVGGFIQEVIDEADLTIGEPLEFVRVTKRVNDMLQELEENGFYVFADTEKQILEGGIIDSPICFRILHLTALRQNDSRIVDITRVDNAKTQVFRTIGDQGEDKLMEVEKN
ncbi:hypothetical protein AGMMS50267_16690 [Spirochaetia bacterium]|nr:hypothetical protein AGMMS50267_16690 [Spirochaetia bacterium]